MQRFLKGQDDNAKSLALVSLSNKNKNNLGLCSTGATLCKTFLGHDTLETGKQETPSTSESSESMFPHVDKDFLNSLLSINNMVNNQVTAQGNGSLSEAKASNPICYNNPESPESLSETKEGGRNTQGPNLNHLIHGVPACNLEMESKPNLKGRPLGTRTMIEEILDEEFLDSSSLDVRG